MAKVPPGYAHVVMAVALYCASVLVLNNDY